MAEGWGGEFINPISRGPICSPDFYKRRDELCIRTSLPPLSSASSLIPFGCPGCQTDSRMREEEEDTCARGRGVRTGYPWLHYGIFLVSRGGEGVERGVVTNVSLWNVVTGDDAVV